MAVVTRIYLTVGQAAEQYPAFTQGSFRWLIFNKARNGFAPVVRKLGRKLVLDKDEFEAWIERGACGVIPD